MQQRTKAQRQSKFLRRSADPSNALLRFLTGYYIYTYIEKYNTSRGLPPEHTFQAIVYKLIPTGQHPCSCRDSSLFELLPQPTPAVTFFALAASRASMCGCHHMIQTTGRRRDLEPLRTPTHELSISVKTSP